MLNEESGFHYVERYQEGQYTNVWNELVQLGPAVFEDRFHAEALAVARAMMRRVRTNIETLITKLLQRGFIFGYDIRLQEHLAHSFTSPQERERYIQICERVREQPPVFLPAKHQEERIAETEQFLEQDPALAMFVDVEELRQEKKQLQQMSLSLDKLEQIVGPVPLAVRAWFEEIAAVNFFGYHPQWSTCIPSFPEEPLWPHMISENALMSYCDPLQICALTEEKIEHMKKWYMRDKRYIFEFAQDHHFKDFYGGTSTPYYFSLPQASIDAIMPDPFGSGSTTFVEYIRFSLAWAGFPGMSQWPDFPRTDLETLTHDLLPF